MNHLLRLAALAACGPLGCALSAAQGLPTPPSSPVPVVKFEYDAEGNPTRQIVAPDVSGLNLTTQQSYDNLHRLKDSTDARNGLTQFGYDGRNNTTRVTDPRQLVTSYPRDGLGQATSLISPDTGTATHTYDAAGNLKTRTDSRGVTATYSYDALNRLTQVVYTQAGQPSRTLSWTYDQSGAGFSHGAGRLTSSTYPEGSAQFAYDAQGRLTQDTRRLQPAAGANTSVLTHTVGYGYTAAGQISQIVYPSGRVVHYTYTQGQLSGIGLAAQAGASVVPLLGQIQFAPFGAARAWQWHLASGTQAHERVFDTSGRLVRYRLGAVVRDLSYDAASRITAYTHYDATTGAAQPALDQSFGYDELGRLTSVTTAAASWTLGYDANGNRTQVTLNGTTSTYTTATDSNRLLSTTAPSRSFSHDAAGNTTNDSTRYGATYGLDNRLVTLTASGATTLYAYNNEGQRVRKHRTSGGATVVFVYAQDGQLLGEYDAAGAPIKEYVWLGTTPVAVFTPDAANSANPPLAYFIHTDHLDTPRVVVDSANALRWRWMAEPFGSTAAEPSPSGLTPFALNLRFPGQYFDSESGLHYNWHRDYDSSVGRYAQSDPIGLNGGINTYAYVSANPLSYTDSMGLWSTEAHNYFLNELFPGLDPRMMAALQAGSRYADSFRFQDAASAFMHAMSSNELSPEESRKRMCQFIKDKRDLYGRYARDPKLQWSAFFEMGMALHAAMDATSPAHRGFQRWRYRNTLDHGPNKPGAPSMEDVDTAVHYRSETLDLMRKAFNGTLDCNCLP